VKCRRPREWEVVEVIQGMMMMVVLVGKEGVTAAAGGDPLVRCKWLQRPTHAALPSPRLASPASCRLLGPPGLSLSLSLTPPRPRGEDSHFFPHSTVTSVRIDATIRSQPTTMGTLSPGGGSIHGWMDGWMAKET
jgi:hypothetical protein